MLNLGWNLLWTVINLIVLYFLLNKFLIKPVTGIMEKRKNLIASQLSEAKNTQEQALGLKEQYETALNGVKTEADQIRESARMDAKRTHENSLKDANEQAARIMENGRVRAEQEKENAMADAKSQIADLALQTAKKLLAGGSSEEGNLMLYDQFLTEAGEADDRNH